MFTHRLSSSITLRTVADICNAEGLWFHVDGAFGAWAAIAPLSFAQQQGLRNTTPEQRAKAQTFFMERKLNLTPEQTEKVYAINLKYAQEMNPVIMGSEGKLRKLREARTIEQDKDADMKAVLSPEQYQSYLASKEEIRQMAMERMKENR